MSATGYAYKMVTVNVVLKQNVTGSVVLEQEGNHRLRVGIRCLIKEGRGLSTAVRVHELRKGFIFGSRMR